MASDPDDEQLAGVLADVDRVLPLAPRVELVPATARGAVAQVVGVAGRSGERFMVKVFPAEVAHRADVEVLALGLAARGGVPVPRVVHAGALSSAVPSSDPAGGTRRVAYVVMTRLTGTRWAELRHSLTAGQSVVVARRAGETLRRIHRIEGTWFGDLVQRPASRDDAAAALASRSAAVVANFRRTGGDASLAKAAADHIDPATAKMDRSVPPVLCHNDYNGGNIMLTMLTGTGDPAVGGVFDWERARWDDPMRDLSRTCVQLRQQAPQLADAMIDGYGGLSAEQHGRLELHELLQLLEERAWVSVDRPAGWAHSLAALDRSLRFRLSGEG